MKWFHLLRFGLVGSQTDHNHYNQCDEGQQDGEVQVMDVFQHPRSVVHLITRGLWVNEVQQHANAAHQQANNKAPECTLRER